MGFRRPLSSLVIALTVFLIAIPDALAAENQPLSLTDVKVASPLKPGANGQVSFELELKKDHMAYVDQFKLSSPNIAQLKSSKLQLSPTQKAQDPHSGKMRDLVSGNFKMTTVIEIPEDLKRMPSSLEIELVYQACTKKYCYTPKTLKFSLPH